MATQRQWHRGVGVVTGLAVTALLAACSGGGFDEGSGSAEQKDGKADLQVLVGATGPDLTAIQEAADAWSKETGNTVKVQTAADMQQQLSQGFSSGNPPDIFWVDANLFPTYADAGYLHSYGDQMDLEFYPSLVQAFTAEDELYCAPKDFSTLGLVINSDMWAAAGLTAEDYPTTWAELETVATTLTKDGVVGLALGDGWDRVGTFFRQAGGWIMNDDQTEMTIDSPENVEGLTEVQKLLASGVAAFPKELDSGWGGEAIGKGKAAMTIEGNWFKGAASADWPDLNWEVAELPEGPAGKGTLTFTQCWGVADQSEYQAQAVDFVKSMYTVETQVSFAEQFGVMPSMVDARDQYAASLPATEQAWLAGADYAQGPIAAVGMDPVMKDLNTNIQKLPDANPAEILATTQKNGEDVLAKNADKK